MFAEIKTDGMNGKKEFNLTSKKGLDDITDDSVKVFYNQYVSILKNIFNLTNKQSLVLAEILYQNYLFKDLVIDDELRWRAVFDSQNRKQMQENIDFYGSNFSNCLTDLRKKNILKGQMVDKNLVVFPENNAFSLIFNFSIEE